MLLALDLLANGLIYGCFYALMAVGLAMIFGVLKIVNFAHGEFFMIGAYTYVLVALKMGVSPWLALPAAAMAPPLVTHEDLSPLTRWQPSGGWDPGVLRPRPWLDWGAVLRAAT